MLQQMQKNQPIEAFRLALVEHFPSEKVDEILRFYDFSIHNFRLDNYDACLVNAGKMVEAVLKCFHYLRTQEVADAVKVEQEIHALESCTTLDNSIRLRIPHLLKVIYEHRNHRGAAHNNSFDPNQMDATFIVAALKWVLEELARLYLTSNPEQAQKLVTNFLIREIAVIEEIDGSYLILQPSLSARVQLEIMLYRHHPKRCQTKELVSWIGNAHSEANIRVTLSNLKKKALIHENQDGWQLTSSGLREVANEITQIQLSNKVVKKHHIVKLRGTKHGRKR